MTDNRTNEPTPEQVEAAAKALRADDGFMEEVHSALEVSWSEYIARLVLVAAQGAAPQAERDWRLDVVPEPWTDPAPVLPSSGVDEDALAEVIAHAGTNWEYEWAEHKAGNAPDPGPNADYIARAVAEWLKGQGR